MNIALPDRPRVLLADDHNGFLEEVSVLLSATFDIVALASNGHQAVDKAVRLRPDVAVLDVAMPELDGFRTLQRLRRDSPETRVVFLTMHRDDEFVAAAINGGAHGYVLKSRIHLDLSSAIDHALGGRLFVPSLTSLSTVAGTRHTVQFHAGDRHFLDGISELVGATLRSGEQVVIVASEATRVGVAQRLQARQMSLAMLAEQGHYIEQDSALALSQMLHDGKPDRGCLAGYVRDLDRLRLAASHGSGSRLTIVGDVSASLWRNGDLETAMEIERLWNELTHRLPFFTVCTYPTECFAPSAARNLLRRLCNEHSAVTS